MDRIDLKGGGVAYVANLVGDSRIAHIDLEPGIHFCVVW